MRVKLCRKCQEVKYVGDAVKYCEDCGNKFEDVKTVNDMEVHIKE